MTGDNAERKRKAEVQSASVKKVRFKLRGEEFFDNTQVLMEYPDRNHKQSKERNEMYNNDFSFKNTDTERSTVDGSSNVNLSVDETNDFEEGTENGVKCTPLPHSSLSALLKEVIRDRMYLKYLKVR